jgi:DnaJ-class molecular chaperone
MGKRKAILLIALALLAIGSAALYAETQVCSTCGGSGKRISSYSTYKGVTTPNYMTCGVCNGTGYVNR